MQNDLSIIYDQEVEPRLKEILGVCEQAGLPMFFCCQDAPDQYRASAVNVRASNDYKLAYMVYLHQTWSVDEFLRRVLEDARANGHESLFLRAMGVLPRPAPQILDRRRPRSTRRMPGTRRASQEG